MRIDVDIENIYTYLESKSKELKGQLDELKAEIEYFSAKLRESPNDKTIRDTIEIYQRHLFDKESVMAQTDLSLLKLSREYKKALTQYKVAEDELLKTLDTIMCECKVVKDEKKPTGGDEKKPTGGDDLSLQEVMRLAKRKNG